ncbi:zona pellucida sperm-binding protein 3 [Pempheris klunzingeri]|uniref:zona pellucida sperm-binding protein 3 n=1 Tax=Pempheris klunzingeri TaxID=3127111 RepID=UPI00397EE126
MKTKWHLYILWSVLSLGLLSAADSYASPPFLGRKGVFKLGKSKASTSGDRQSSQRSPAGAPPLSQLSFPPPAPAAPRSTRTNSAHLPDVSVTCSTSDFVVRVKPTFYGLGADAEELKLGSSCKSNGLLRPYGDLLFTYPLTACGSVRQSPHGYLVYKFVLHYEPSPKRSLSRAHRIDVDIECRYQRNRHVHRLTVQPTWETAVVRKRLKGGPNDFQIQLMDDSWSRPAKSRVYQLGKTVNLQIFAHHLPAEGKLYVSSCYAIPSGGSKPFLKYTIIDNFGCLLDSKRDPGASQFTSRTANTLRFSIKAFQFISDPDTEVSIHCKLSITSGDPSPAHKSCTYRANRWTALTGDDSICECCDSQCVTPKPRRAMTEGSASSGSVLVSDQLLSGSLPEGEATISQYVDELHSHDMRGSANVVMYDDDDEEEQGYTDEEDQQLEEESGLILGVMAEPELDEFAFRQRGLVEEKVSKQFKEDGSGYKVLGSFSESEEEGFEREDESSDLQRLNQEGDTLHHRVQVEQGELQPLEGEEENKKRGGEEDDASDVEWEDNDDLADLVGDEEATWYFTWR